MNFLLGGRTGDLIHALYVAKNYPGKHNLYITDRRDLHSDGFALGLEKTYEELKPILNNQDYVNSFEIYTNQPFDENLSLWRRYAYSASWTQLLSNTFNVPAVGGRWINVNKKEGVESKVIIHCSINPDRRGHWGTLVDKYEGQTLFIGSQKEYETFGYKMDFYEPTDLHDFFVTINSCKFFIGNQSAPLAIAHALDVPRLAVLNEVDKIAYKGEEKFYKNFYWIAQHEHFFEGLIY
jgi:hypothetical protein